MVILRATCSRAISTERSHIDFQGKTKFSGVGLHREWSYRALTISVKGDWVLLRVIPGGWESRGS